MPEVDKHYGLQCHELVWLFCTLLFFVEKSFLNFYGVFYKVRNCPSVGNKFVVDKDLFDLVMDYVMKNKNYVDKNKNKKQVSSKNNSSKSLPKRKSKPTMIEIKP